MPKTEEYILKMKEGKGSTEEVIEKIRDDKAKELDSTRAELEIEKLKAEIRRLQGEEKPIASTTATNFGQVLFGNRKPAEVKEILDSLDEEGINKLIRIAGAMSNGQLGSLMTALGKPERSMKETIELIQTIVKLYQPQPSTSTDIGAITKSMAEMFKTGVDLGKSQNQPPQQTTLETLKAYHEMFLKPVLDQLASKDRENLELRMKELESRQVNPVDYLKSLKQASADLGLSQTTRNEIDIKLEEMRELHDLEMAKLGFETRKWEHVKANEGKTMEQAEHLIKTVTEGPIGRAIENLGAGAADKIRGGSLVKVQCPNCHGTFGVNPALATVTCVHCGATLARGQASSQQTQEPPAPPPQESPTPQATQEEPKANVQQPEQEPAPQ